MYLPRFVNLLIFALFLLGIWAPLLTGLLRTSPVDALKEKRQLSPRPAFSLATDQLQQFPRRYEDYFDDHFALRSSLIHGYNRLNLALDSSPSEKVLIGREGWFFYRGGRVIEDYTNTELLSVQQMEDWRSALEGKRDYFAMQGIPYLFVIAPNKHTIYPDKLPAGIEKVGPVSRLDQLVDYLARHSDLQVLDLRAPLLERKKAGTRVYYKTDTHWNHVGADIARQQVLV